MFLTFREFSNFQEIRNYLIKIGNTEAGSNILSSKAFTFTIEIDGIDTRAANILKQDAISVGADCAVPRIASNFEKGNCKVLLIANKRSLEKLIEKLSLQPFKLSELSEHLKTILENYSKSKFNVKLKDKTLMLDKPVIMGILNVTPDSFSDGGLYIEKESAYKCAEKMLKEGASIIDIGGESTRPGSKPVSAEEEIKRVIPVIELLKNRLGSEIIISIDTYKSEVAKEALKFGVDIVNDISGTHFDEKMVDVEGEFDCPIVITHIKGTPQNMQKNPYYEDVIKEIIQYFEKTIDKLLKRGIKKEKIIIDPGIGFGKRVEDNLCILKRLNEFKIFGLPVLIGTSRKSFIGKITNEADPKKRLSGTLATIYASAIRGAKILRVHDVKETANFLKILNSLEGLSC